MACDFQKSQENGKSVNYSSQWDYNKTQVMNLKYLERHY